MIVKIHTDKNTGSCANLIQYLEKENRDTDLGEEEHFFNNEQDSVQAATVERMLDGNKGRLSQDETKFYMLTVNPSAKELAHIGNDENRLKSYVNDLMDTYARNFNRTYKDGRELSGKDLMYFAKVEHERTYKFGDKKYEKEMAHNAKIRKEVIRNLGDEGKISELERKYIRNSEGTPILEGAKKDGNNLHVHIVVSRYDRSQQMKLSPLSNQRGGKGKLAGKEHTKGFNRDEFVQRAEKLFDQKFQYRRDIKESYHYRLNHGLVLGATDPRTFAKMIAKRAILESIKDKTLQKAVGTAMADPRHLPRKVVAQMEKEAIRAIMQGLEKGAYTNPVTAGVNMAKRTITEIGKQIARSASI